MSGNPKELFEFFRNNRREGRKNRPGLTRPNSGEAGNATSPRVYSFRRDTVAVFGMLAAVLFAAAFLLGVLLGRNNPGENRKIADSAVKNGRLLTPLPKNAGRTDTPRGTGAGRGPSVPAAHIRGPVGRPASPRHYVIRVASYRQSQTGKKLAEKNAAILSERGYPARCFRRGDYITIEVGSFPSASDAAARQMFGKLKAFQIRGGHPFKDAIIVSVSR